MSPSKAKPPTYDEVIADSLRTVTGPVPAADLVEQMLAARPSQAKNPRQAMRQHLREAVGRLLVFVDADTVLPLRLAFQGVRFRLPLDRDTRTRPARPAPGTLGGGGASVVSRGLLDIGDSLPSYLPLSFPVERVRFVDAFSQPIAFQIRKLSEKVDSPFGRTTIERLSADLGGWFRAKQVGAKDWLLLTIMDWEQGIIQLARESLSQYDPTQRAARNRLLADLFYALLESSTDEQIDVHDAVPTVYARLPEKEGYPPDHWAAVLAADERLTTDGWGMIRYRDAGPSSLLEKLVPDWFDEQRRVPSQPVSNEHGAQVYGFRAALDRNYPREPEVLGRLVNVNYALNDMLGYQSAAERLLTVDPGEHDLRPALASAYLRNGLPTLALRSLREFLRLAPSHPKAGDARGMLADLERGMPALLGELGAEGDAGLKLAELHEEVQSYLNQGEYACARQAALGVLRQKPDIAPVLNRQEHGVTQGYAAEGYLSEALATTERVLAFDTQNVARALEPCPDSGAVGPLR